MAMTLVRHLAGMERQSTRQDGDVPQAWWYRGATSVTLYQRIGKRDVKVGRYPLTAFAGNGAAETLRLARHAARDVVNKAATAAAAAPVAPRERGRPAGQLGTAATWRDVWLHFRREVQANGKWGARTASQNDHRIARHLAGRPANPDTREAAIEPHPMWCKPMALTSASDVNAVLAPLRRNLPGEEAKLRGLLNLAVTTGKALHVMPDGADPVRGALRLMSATSNESGSTPLPAVTDVRELRAILQRIQDMPAAPALRAALTLQAFTGHRSDRIMAARLEHFHPPAKGKPWRWVTPRHLMKIKAGRKGMPWDHDLWLPPQVVALLEAQPTWKDRAKGGWLFPGRNADSHISNLDKPLRDLLGPGVHVPHGWRSAIKTCALGQVVKLPDGVHVPRFHKTWVDAVTDHKPQGIDAHYVRAQAVEGGAQVLAWWCKQLTAA